MGLALDVLLFSGIVLFGVGFFWRDRRCHLARVAGWAAFGVFWFLQFPSYVEKDDPLNALGTAVALPIFLYLGYHEKLSYDWKEEYQPLRFLAVGAFWAAAIYFTVDRIPALSGGLIQIVTDHTSALLNSVSSGYTVGPVSYGANTGLWRVDDAELYAPILDPAAQTDVVNIVLACTAIQAIAVAAALIFSTRDDPRRKLLATAVIFPVTYVMNLVRNTVVIHYYYTAGQDFDIVHSGYGKGLSLLVTAILLLLAFYLLPELYVVLNGLYDLPWRKAPGWDYRKNVGTLFRKSRERSRDKEGGAPPPVKGPAE